MKVAREQGEAHSKRPEAAFGTLTGHCLNATVYLNIVADHVEKKNTCTHLLIAVSKRITPHHKAQVNSNELLEHGSVYLNGLHIPQIHIQ